MATAMNVKEISWRLGCGRYIQENGALAKLGEEVRRLGAQKPFIIGSKTALALTREQIEKSLAAAQLHGVFETYAGFCCKETCAELLAGESFVGCDCIIGVGGGNIMDAAKYCAVQQGLPIINVPTSSATCAAFTPLSVCYTKEGQTVGTVHHKTEVNAVLADMDILCRQPVRLLLAGIYDALAKLYETNQRLLGLNLDEMDVGLVASYHMSTAMCEALNRTKAVAVADVAAGKCTKTVYDVVYMSIALTGVISGLARGSNQCAIAHKIYEASRTLFPREVYSFLHGELVAIGLIAQIAYNNEPSVSAADFAAQMKAFGMPLSLREVGVDVTNGALEKLYDKVMPSSAMAGTTKEEHKKLYEALKIIL